MSDNRSQSKRDDSMSKLPITARLRHHLQRWRRFTRNKTVLSIIKRGLFISLRDPILKKRSFFMKCQDKETKKQLTKTIEKFLKQGVIEAAPTAEQEEELVSLFFPIPKKGSNKLRWIIDLKELSQHVNKKAFKMETLEYVREMIQPGDWMISIDLMDAFYHLLVQPRVRKYLRFVALGQKWQYRALPMGLSNSPWALSRVMAEFVRKMRALKIRLSCYADDLILLATDQATCIKHRDVVIQNMKHLGLTPNFEKSTLTPTRKMKHLGFILNTEKNRIFTTTETRLKLAKLARRISEGAQAPTARKVASLLGLINHTTTAMPSLRWRKKNLERDLNHQVAPDWNNRIHLSEATRSDLKALTDTKYLHRFNGSKLTLHFNPSTIITSDASPRGWGATISIPSRGIYKEVQATWEDEVANRSSNQKELAAVSRAFFAFKHLFPKKAAILIQTDNTTAMAYINGRGSIPELVEIFTPMQRYIEKKRLQVKASHIPGVMNDRADFLSRVFKKDHDWEISTQAFRSITHKFGPMAFDLFASWQNTKVESYAAWGPDPRAQIIDCLKQNWQTIPSPWYLVPPWPVMSKVISKLKEEIRLKHNFRSVLIAPLWKGASWFPELMGITQEWMELPPGSIQKGPSGRLPINESWDVTMIAALIVQP